jgi:hypothetical protein
MPRGGKRKGSGAKPKWKHGKTTVIRVPEALADQILSIAREIDEHGFYESATDSKIIDMSDCPLLSINSKTAVFLGDLMASGYQIFPDILSQRIVDEIYKSQIKRANGVFSAW